MDDVLGSSQSAESAPVATSVPTESQSERTFRQSEVNDLVKRVKHDAVEDYRRLQSKQPEYAEQKYGQQQQSQQHLSESEIKRLASEEIQKQRDAWQAETQSKYEQDNAARIVKNFWDKVASGKDKYDDYEQVTGSIKLARFPNVVQLLSEHIDNADEVLYELGRNRGKLAQLEQLSLMSPEDAIEDAKRLAGSIKANESSRNIRKPNAPLSQQRPSTVGTDAGNTLSIRDLKAKYRG
jgi:hypothetical protein